VNPGGAVDLRPWSVGEGADELRMDGCIWAAYLDGDAVGEGRLAFSEFRASMLGQ